MSPKRKPWLAALNRYVLRWFGWRLCYVCVEDTWAGEISPPLWWQFFRAKHSDLYGDRSL